MTVEEKFTSRLAAETESLFVVVFFDGRGHRLWFDRNHALAFAFALSVLHHRKQKVHGELVNGRWLWHVRAVPVGDLVAESMPMATEEGE